MKRGENRLNNSLQLKKLFEQLQVTTKTKISSQKWVERRKVFPLNLVQIRFVPTQTEPGCKK